jgi:hypothetical protein
MRYVAEPRCRQRSRNKAGSPSVVAAVGNALYYLSLLSWPAVGTASANRQGVTNREEAMSMKIAEKFEQVMMAAAFAEENEHATARELISEQRTTERVAARPAPRPQPRQTLRAD